MRPILQAGALCVRRQGRHDESEVLLISSRSTGRWGIPKGHMEPGETVRQVAEREAYEEAGVRGIALEPAIGQFSYRKVPRLEQRLKSYLVTVHLVFVQSLMIDYPESGARRVEWMPMRVAAGGWRMVSSAALSGGCGNIRAMMATPLRLGGRDKASESEWPIAPGFADHHIRCVSSSLASVPRARCPRTS